MSWKSHRRLGVIDTSRQWWGLIACWCRLMVRKNTVNGADLLTVGAREKQTLEEGHQFQCCQKVLLKLKQQTGAFS